VSRVRADRGVFLTVGVPSERSEYWLQRALDILHRQGFQAGVTSDEAVVLAAGMVEREEEERPTGG
jgi:hypothetical protein